jgi:hypothetical protein
MSLVVLGIRSERNAPKIKNQDCASTTRQCFNKPVSTDQGFLNKELCGHTIASPILS